MKIATAILFIFLIKIEAFAQSFSQSSLPIVEINTNGITIPSDGKINATMEITFNGLGLLTNINDEPTIWSGPIVIGVRGASSSNYPQKSYNFTTRMDAQQDSNIVILDMPREHDWSLINNWNDKSFVRNTLAQKIFSEMGHYGVRMHHCEVTLNGQYIGIYLLSEKIKVDKGRVDVSKLSLTDNAGAPVSGGYIIKNDIYDGSNGWPSKFSPLGHATSEHPYFLYEYPKPSNITTAQKNYIQSFIDSLETVLYGPSFDDLVNGYTKFISRQSFVDYFLLNEVSRNVDGNKKSSYWHKDRWDQGGKLKAGPVWDFDWAWKNIWDCDQFSNTDGSGWSYKIVDCPADVLGFGWFKRLLQDPQFTSALDCRWSELRAGVLSTTSIYHYIDSVEQALALPQQRHFTTFPELGQNNGAPEVDASPTTYHGEIVKLKNWIQTRMLWLDSNMPGTCGVFTAIKEKKESELVAYPNPSHGSFHIFNYGNNIKYTMYNVLGAAIENGELIQGENIFQLQVPKGLYVFVVGRQVLKIMID